MKRRDIIGIDVFPSYMEMPRPKQVPVFKTLDEANTYRCPGTGEHRHRFNVHPTNPMFYKCAAIGCGCLLERR